MAKNNKRSDSEFARNAKRRKKSSNALIIGIAVAALVIIAAVLIIAGRSNKGGGAPETDAPETVTEAVTTGAYVADKIPETTQEVTEEVTSEAETTAKAPETTEAPDTTAKAPETTKAQETTKAPETTAPDSSGTSSKGYKIETKNGVTYVGGILIANKTYSLPSGYGSGLTGEMNSALEKMFSAAAAEGYDLHVVSGFRSYSRQETLYNNYCNRDGKAAADTYSARPGHSEHQTGLAADINSVETSWGKTPEGKWLAANCHKYGFIIRYPAGKEGKTGYQYEPWHVRYLGVETATAVYNSGLCLEEYLGITSTYAD